MKRVAPTAAGGHGLSVAREVSTDERACFVCRAHPELRKPVAGEYLMNIRIGTVVDGVLCIPHAAILRDTLSAMMPGVSPGVPDAAPIKPAPIAMRLACEACGELHIDEGEFATKPHHTHSCQNCGLTWRPAIAHTVGVRFLPGFKNETPTPTPTFSSTTIKSLEDIVADLQRLHPDRFREERPESAAISVSVGDLLYAEIGDEYIRFKVDGWKDNVVFGITEDRLPLSADRSLLSVHAPTFKLGDIVQSISGKPTFEVTAIHRDPGTSSGFRYWGTDENRREWHAPGETLHLAKKTGGTDAG